jgi:UPF0716 protein FxsA
MALFALFVLVPLIEIALFVKVGGWLTLWPTLAIVVATALAGSMLLRRQGTLVLRQLQAEVEALRDPLSPLTHGALVLAGGVMMILPGFLTDLLGISLMVPAVRRAVIRLILSRLAARGGVAGFSFARAAPRGQGPGEVIEGEWHEAGPEPRRPSGWTKD